MDYEIVSRSGGNIVPAGLADLNIFCPENLVCPPVDTGCHGRNLNCGCGGTNSRCGGSGGQAGCFTPDSFKSVQ